MFKKKGGVESSSFKSGSGSFGLSTHNVYTEKVNEGYGPEVHDGKNQGSIQGLNIA